MSAGFVLIVAKDRACAPAIADRLERASGLSLALVRPAVALLAGAGAFIPIARVGVVIGTLFRRHGASRPLSALEEGEAEAIFASGGRKLLDSYWGGYLAVLETPQGVRVMRDPSAALPVYFCDTPEFTLFSSEARLLAGLGIAPVGFNWPALARYFYNAGVPVPETALLGITELLPGFAVEVGAHSRQQVPWWSPWDHVREPAAASPERHERLGRAVRQAVQGWASRHGRLLLSVSGGLDSSIVAACLAEAGADVTCLTMYGEDPNGDERTYARALCSYLRLPLVERPYRFEDIDIAAPLSDHLPRPIGRTQSLAFDRVHIDVARETNAEAFVSGNGGDSVFAFSQSAAAIADRWLVEGFGSGLFATFADVRRQTGCGALAAAASAARIARDPASYCCRPNRLLLHPDVLALEDGVSPHHPWLEAPREGLPGKAAHIASILRVQHCLEPPRGEVIPVLNPLMSQPVIEACLALPSWAWREGGRDRAAARRAFARALPSCIIDRRAKGGPDGFAAAILDRFRAPIRERLLEGRLAHERIIDSAAAERLLRDERPNLGEERVRILEFLAAEAWLEAWLEAWGGRAAGARGGGLPLTP